MENNANSFLSVTPTASSEFVTEEAVFQIGNNNGLFKGYGGHEFTLWFVDGTRKDNVSDIWRGSDRIDQPITVVKMESSFNPYEYYRTNSFGLITEDSEIILMDNSFHAMFTSIKTNSVTKTELQDFIENNISKETGIRELILERLVVHLEESKSLTFHMCFHDMAEDVKIMEKLYEAKNNLNNNSKLEAFGYFPYDLLEQASWVYSMTPFNKELTEAKELARERKISDANFVNLMNIKS